MAPSIYVSTPPVSAWQSPDRVTTRYLTDGDSYLQTSGVGYSNRCRRIGHRVRMSPPSWTFSGSVRPYLFRKYESSQPTWRRAGPMKPYRLSLLQLVPHSSAEERL